MKIPLPLFPRLSMRKKVILIVIVSQLLIIGVAVYTMLQNEHEIIETSLKEGYLRYSRSLSHILLYHLQDSDRYWIDFHIGKVAQEDDVVFVVVHDDEGRVLSNAGRPADSDRLFLDEGFRQVKETRVPRLAEIERDLGTFLHEKGHIFHLVVPIEEGSRFLGTIGIAFNTEKWNRIVSASSLLGLRLVFLAALLGAVAILVDQKLRGVIGNLIQVAVKMAEGDLSQKVDIHTGDEFEKLGAAFNSMAAKLEVSNKKLREWACELEKKVAERTEQIEEERQKLDRIVSGIGAGLVLIDRDLRVAWVNEHYRKKLTAGKDGITGTKCYSALWGEESPCRNCTASRTFASGKIEKGRRQVKAGRDMYYYSITAAPINDESGNVTQVLELIQDETESKKIEIQLERASKMAAIGEFAAGVAHEINNPLASVAAYAERLSFLLQKDRSLAGGKRDKFLSYLERIQDQAYRTKEITSGILDFVMESREAPRLYRLDLNRVVEKASALLELHIKGQEVELRKDLAPDLYGVADEGQLEQVFLNLIKNSLDTVSERGEIIIKTWKDNHEVYASVQDNGRGMDQEEVQRIFNPFYTTKEPGKSTGLGLSICYGLMKRFGGDIKVESTLGQGSVFTLCLPEAEQEG